MNRLKNKVTLKPILGIKPQLYIPFIYITLLILIVGSIILVPTLINKKSYIKSVSISKLKSDNGLVSLESSYNEAAKWSLINSSEINSRYQIPNIISASISNYYNYPDFDQTILENYLNSSFKLVTGEYILSDFLRGLLIAKSDNRLPSISSIKESALFINHFVKKQPNAPLLLYNKIIHNPKIKMNETYYQGLIEKQKIILNKSVTTYSEPDNDIIIGNYRFKNIPASKITPIDVNFIHTIEEDTFYILEEMISKESYLEFLNENPTWSKLNKQNLIKDGLVDKFYLEFTNNEDYITNISYYSAIAWCNWANNNFQLPEGWKLQLPTENMWFSAIQFGVVKNIDAWQWTSQGFFLYEHFLADKNGKPLDSFSEITPRVVVGKNKYNSKVESGRGVQDADWCTPFISFRPVLVKE